MLELSGDGVRPLVFGHVVHDVGRVRRDHGEARQGHVAVVQRELLLPAPLHVGVIDTETCGEDEAQRDGRRGDRQTQRDQGPRHADPRCLRENRE